VCVPNLNKVTFKFSNKLIINEYFNFLQNFEINYFPINKEIVFGFQKRDATSGNVYLI